MSLFGSTVTSLAIFFMVLSPFVIIVLIVYALKSAAYKKTEYYSQTKVPYLTVLIDKGRNGEYLTCKYLHGLSGYKKWLFNCYIPKENGETAEIDVIMLHESGIYVFESKNYSGWIFGNENQKQWTQALPARKGNSQKNHFFNPIMQNKIHLKWLRSYLGNKTLPFYSYIVFSDRCTLKDISLTSNTHFVINRFDLLKTVRQNVSEVGITLTKSSIDSLYQKLYPLTQTDAAVKLAHIENIQKKHVNQSQPSVSDAEAAETKAAASDVVSDSAVSSAAVPAAEPANDICPVCGRKLVLRTVSKGDRKGLKFFGCSNYPKCRYIKNIEE